MPPPIAALMRLSPDERELFMELWTTRSPEARERYRRHLLERAPERARLLELDARRTGGPEDEDIRREITTLLDPVDREWFSAIRRRLDRELFNCGAAAAGSRAGDGAASIPDPRVRFRVVCPQRWDRLEPTDQAGVRYCGECAQPVHACETSEEVAQHARAGHCVAVPSDLVSGEVRARTRRVMGQPDGLGEWIDALFDADAAR